MRRALAFAVALAIAASCGTEDDNGAAPCFVMTPETQVHATRFAGECDKVDGFTYGRPELEGCYVTRRHDCIDEVSCVSTLDGGVRVDQVAIFDRTRRRGRMDIYVTRGGGVLCFGSYDLSW